MSFSAPIPEAEADRLAALASLDLVGSAPDERFDRITRTVASLLDVPIAALNLVDDRQQWALSAIGMDQGASVPREHAFCAHVVGGATPLVVAATHDDSRFRDNPLVTSAPYLQSYAGMPVRAHGGPVVGTLCIADQRPRDFDQAQLRLLRDLAGWVEAELDRSRIAAARLREAALHQRLELVFRAVGDAVVVFDGTGRIGTANEVASDWFGGAGVPLAGRSVLDLLPDGVLRSSLSRLPVEAAPPSAGHEEFEVVRADGVRVPVEAGVVVVPDSGELVLVARDVTERHRHDAARDHLRRLYASILDAAGDGIIGLDVDGRVTYANPAADRLLGVTAGGLLGVDVHERFHHHRADGSPYPWEECPSHSTLTHGVPQASPDETFFRADGTPFLVDYASTPLLDDDRVVGAVMLLRDVEEQRAVERMKDAFVATASHELRTPLTSIKGTMALVLGGVMGEIPTDVRDLLEVSHHSTDRLIRLVNDLLDVERLTGGHLTLACADTDTAALVADAVAEVRGAADVVGIRIETDVAATPMTVDADRIVQALTNLLANAVKFSPPGGAVRVTEVVTDDEVTLTVADDGRGIPEDAHERIFTRFGQADASDQREKSGTGLGLPIARGLVEQHGGRLEVDSRPGEGSRFLLTLPRDGEVPT